MDCVAALAMTMSRSRCDQLARRANHQRSVHPPSQKYSARAVGQISDLTPRVSRRMKGASRSSRTCG